jgi:hypothetical protein
LTTSDDGTPEVTRTAHDTIISIRLFTIIMQRAQTVASKLMRSQWKHVAASCSATHLAQRHDLFIGALRVGDVVELRHHVPVLAPLARQDLFPAQGSKERERAVRQTVLRLAECRPQAV